MPNAVVSTKSYCTARSDNWWKTNMLSLSILQIPSIYPFDVHKKFNPIAITFHTKHICCFSTVLQKSNF